MSPMRWSAMRMFDRMIDRISSSITPALEELDRRQAQPLLLDLGGVAEKPPGTDAAGVRPVAGVGEPAPEPAAEKNGFTNFTSMRCVPPRYGSLTMKTSPGSSAIFSRSTRSITACIVNCMVPTKIGRPSSPWAISSPLSR